uniref:Rho GTPase-activating protein 15 n=1 Tax=Ceratitis capitata TaxID=7213 RepID=W8CB81_CERCA
MSEENFKKMSINLTRSKEIGAVLNYHENSYNQELHYVNEKDQPIYENMDNDLLEGQKSLLKTLFRNVEKDDVVYENLCRGCGYGVFESQSYLCNFCLCITEGLKKNQSRQLKENNKMYVNNSDNIYENICVNCSNLFNTKECEYCTVNINLSKAKQLKLDTSRIYEKITKSQTVLNLDRYRFFGDIFGPFKRGLKAKQNLLSEKESDCRKKKSLAIIHNVEGYNNIFHTNQTFDIKGISKLKQAAKFNSEQHIYGQLQFNEFDNIAGESLNIFLPNQLKQEQLTSTSLMAHTHISESCLLEHQSISNIPFNVLSDKKLRLHCTESVCYWMKLLRKQVHNYHSYGQSLYDGEYGMCMPKSLPSKSILMDTHCKPNSSNTINDNFNELPIRMGETNNYFPVIDKGVEVKDTRHTSKLNAKADSSDTQVNESTDTMVDVFKQNILTKCVLYKQRERQPSVEHSSLLYTERVARSPVEQAKYQTYNENSDVFDCPSEYSPITIMNYQALSTVNVENRLTSCYCVVSEVNTNRCGCLNARDCAPNTEFERVRGDIVEKSQNKNYQEDTKREFKSIIKTETSNEFNCPEGQNEQYVKINDKCCHNSPVINEGNREINFYLFTLNLFGANDRTLVKVNFVRLVNYVLISYSLNTKILFSCSNQLQLFNWLQDWLLYYFNPWSLKAKRALEVLSNNNNLKISLKLWTVLNESVRHTRLEKYDKQEKSICVCNEAISSMEFKSGPERGIVVDENSDRKLTMRQNVVTKISSKASEEVILRTKSKESLERSKKAQGKFLDFDKVAIEADDRVNTLLCNNFAEADLKIGNISCNKLPTVEKKNSNNTKQEIQSEEDIYQPIWKFQTVGDALYDSDPEYYNLSSRTFKYFEKKQRNANGSNDSSLKCLLISDSAKDHSEWETDDEFKYSKEFDECGRAMYAMRSQISLKAFSQSKNTLTSITSSNFRHPLIRAVCIFFSLKEPKARAIIYDYNRNKSSQYFSKKSLLHSSTDTDIPTNCLKPRATKNDLLHSFSLILPSNELNKTCSEYVDEMSTVFNLKPVYAWKFDLLNTSSQEDEEDLIVSEEAILGSQIIKHDFDHENLSPIASTFHLVKSASFGDLLEIPNEDDKKSITERMRSKFQRGVLKLNVRSPKSEKKNRSAKTESLYIEEGIRPKYPIFSAPLKQLEMNETIHQNVPRFVVDCVSYIERKEYILQDGLYRASGNKVAIDELKKKLTECYIYDSKLLIVDDIHTITSLLKQFFREISQPLIPQHIYNEMSRNFSDVVNINMLRNILDEVPDPNRATLKFLVRHLKNVAAFSTENRMPASNLAIVWGPCIFSSNQTVFVDIGRTNTLTKLLIENYDYIFRERERLVN